MTFSSTLRASGLALGLLIVGCRQPDSPTPAPAPEPSPAPVVGSPAPKPPPDLGAGFVEPKTSAPHGTLLRLRFKTGDTIKRELKGSMQISAVAGSPPPAEEALQPTTLSMTYTTTVQAVKDGVATLKVASTPLHVQKQAGKGDWVPSKDGELQIDARGRIYTDVQGLVSGIQGIGIIPFPEGKVAKGTAWSHTSARDMAPFGLVKMTETYTYEGLSGGLHRVRLSATGSLPGLKAAGVFLYRAVDLALQSADLTQGAVIDVPGKDAPTKVRMEMTVSVRTR